MSTICVGNDIVDLANPRTQGRAADDRFVDRVFDADERGAIRSAPDPDLELWCRWAAKEAGFKAISKLVGAPPPFVHRLFKVAWSEGADPADTPPVVNGGDGAVEPRVVRRGTVSWDARRAEVTVALHPGGVHAVAFAALSSPPSGVRIQPRVALLDSPRSPWSGSLEELLSLLTAREADAVYSQASAAVRVGARGALAELIGVPERRLEIVCAPGPTSQRPPRVLLDGTEAEADVSLSHDGRLIAWAVWADLQPKDPS